MRMPKIISVQDARKQGVTAEEMFDIASWHVEALREATKQGKGNSAERHREIAVQCDLVATLL